MKFQPNSDRVLIDIDEQEKVGTFYVPEIARQSVARTGTVVAKGPGRKDSDVRFEIGDKVLVDNIAGIPVKVDGKEYLLVRQEEILGRLVDVE